MQRHNIKQIIYLTLIIKTFISCTTQENTKDIATQWHNKNILFSFFNNSYKQDSLWLTMLHNKFKILTIVDSNSCTECHLQLHEWKKLIEETDSIMDNLSFLFVIFPQKEHSIELLKQKNKFTYPIFYDHNGILWQLNKFPTDSRFQTFLLNSQNQVLLIGNPLNNKHLWDLYKKIIFLKG